MYFAALHLCSFGYFTSYFHSTTFWRQILYLKFCMYVFGDFNYEFLVAI